MTKTLHTTMPRGMGERLFLYGPPDAGKTTAALQIARACPDARFYMIDAEQNQSVAWLLHNEFTDVRDRGQCDVRWIDPNSWEEWTETIAELAPKVGDHDWLTIDPLATWKAVQEYQEERVHGRDWVEFYDKAANFQDVNWKQVKARHDRDFWRVLRKVRGHILVTARAKSFADKEKSEVLALYGPAGCKPEGEGLLGHWPHSVIYARATRRGDVEATSLKERGRRGAGFDGTQIRNWAYQYLKDIAGWQMEEIQLNEEMAN